jgi:hypothetical protein
MAKNYRKDGGVPWVPCHKLNDNYQRWRHHWPPTRRG